METKPLTQKVIDKADILRYKITKMSNLFIVPGSCGDTYHIMRDLQTGGFICINNSKNEYCKGFRYRGDCSHLLAVRMLDEGEV